MTRERSIDSHLRLSPRERETCMLLVSGLRGKEIAQRMNISLRTLDDYRAGVFRKFGVRNGVELTLAFYGLEKPEAPNDHAAG